MELAPQELWPRISDLPSLWEPPRTDPKVRTHVLQAVLSQQRKGDWFYQGWVILESIYRIFSLIVKRYLKGKETTLGAVYHHLGESFKRTSSALDGAFQGLHPSHRLFSTLWRTLS